MKQLTYARDLPARNCMYGHNQFEPFNIDELKQSLVKTIEEAKDSESYFRRAYANADELVIQYKKALLLPPMEMVLHIHNLKMSYVRYSWYLTNAGGICLHKPCCK